MLVTPTRAGTLALVLTLPLALAMAPVPADAQGVGWVNGDFEQSDLFWTASAATTFTDADADGEGDGDLEAMLDGCASTSEPFLARELTMGPLPATTNVTFVIEQGHFSYLVLMGLVDVTDPLGDRAVLAWFDVDGPTGRVWLDPIDAGAQGIPGWGAMDANERQAALTGFVYADIRISGCAFGFGDGATLDDVAWTI